MANVGEVLFALGEVAGAVERAGRATGEAETAFRNAYTGLTEATAGSHDQDAREATEYMAMAISKAGEVDDALHAILGKVSTIVGSLINPDGTTVPPGARAARAPIEGRAHPANSPAPPRNSVIMDGLPGLARSSRNGKTAAPPRRWCSTRLGRTGRSTAASTRR
ncbi:hypothetical protein [Kutzneria chonburiensis]|uniref:hypothetical protein n=1 Tax=Kutzneria chonburiensis TaxID=1483604 RepID=UPI00235E58C7|nr:hypothetical protein [Kutzneria chonburiensis]